jgi:predicted unusual protein kinase regulating ubiquinone biosynthesis (AarF/ABC1/UbiB family)
MAVSLKPTHLKRYKDVAVLLVKYGRGDLANRLDVDAELSPGAAAASEKPKAEELARDLERLGPTFVKVGQLLSTRADLLPVAYLEALARLQDDVEPFSFAEVERIVGEELGVRISKAFTDFEATPLAAASLGQVHRATLRDGRAVAVKIHEARDPRADRR